MRLLWRTSVSLQHAQMHLQVTQALEQKQVAMQVGGPLGFAKEVPAVKIHLLLVWHMFFSR